MMLEVREPVLLAKSLAHQKTQNKFALQEFPVQRGWVWYRKKDGGFVTQFSPERQRLAS
jgi:hypothetical protein